ncbi:FlgO family outer membrane protein [Fundidesulfovibrio agrisoli]|uniref:FlgO family outer membrane protein n=1 Tax=Fundidesulfovibrio agrisoli TaxID=2922717 RepID=UPI001FAC0EE2|nr:FlgO family outer membrane protein [Fundidesulfovibrio agrisoli]
MRYAALLILLSISACAPMANGEMASLIPSWGGDKPDMNEYYPQAARIMADELDAQMAPRLGVGQSTTRGLQWLVVTTPSDLNNMGQATPLARVLAEELGSAMTAKGYYVQEIRKTSEVVFNKAQGEFMLSRDVRQLVTRQFQSTLVLTGTYVSTPYGVRFNIEVVDARNNDVLAKSSKVIPMSRPVAYLNQTQTPGQSNVRPTVVTTPGTDTSVDPYTTPQGDWRTTRQKVPNFLLP